MSRDGPAARGSPRPEHGANGKRRLALAFWILNIAAVAVMGVLTASRFWRGDGFGDFGVFHDAFRAVLAGEDLYASGTGNYIYPPLFAVVFAPLGLLSIEHAGTLYTLVNAGVGLACLWLAASETLRRFDAEADLAATPAVMLFALAVFADKFRIELQGGQTDFWILLCALLGLRWLGRRPLLAGLMLGLAANLKYQTLIVLPYLLIRGRWRALGSTVASMVGFALSSALFFGWDRNLGYLARAFGGLGRMVGLGVDDGAANVQQIAWIRSISLPSVFARLQAWAGWPGWTMPALTLFAAGLTGLGVLALYRRHGERAMLGRVPAADDATAAGRAIVLLEWTGLLVAACVFGPQTNPRHMLLMLPLATIAGMLVLVARPRVVTANGSPANGLPARWPVLAASVFLLLALVLPPGGRSTEHLVHAWRWIGGVSIATLTLLFAVLHGGLAWAHARRAAEPGANNEAPRRGPHDA